LPAAAYCGRKDLMERVAPVGPVYQAGTLSGNPLAMRAGVETLRRLALSNVYEELELKSSRLADGIRGALDAAGIAAQIQRAGSLMTVFFCAEPVRNYGDAKRSDTERFAAFFHQMLKRGVFFAPSQFEALFVSAAHKDADIDRTIAACGDSLAVIAG